MLFQYLDCTREHSQTVSVATSLATIGASVGSDSPSSTRATAVADSDIAFTL